MNDNFNRINIDYHPKFYFQIVDRPYNLILGTPFSIKDHTLGQIVGNHYGIQVSEKDYDELVAMKQMRRNKSFAQTYIKIWKWTFHLSVMTELG